MTPLEASLLAALRDAAEARSGWVERAEAVLRSVQREHPVPWAALFAARPAVPGPAVGVGTRLMTQIGLQPAAGLAPDAAVLHVFAKRLCPLAAIEPVSFDVPSHPDPARLRPVRILAGALRPDCAGSELIVSPDTTLLLGGRTDQSWFRRTPWSTIPRSCRTMCRSRITFGSGRARPMRC